MTPATLSFADPLRRQRGSVLIIVLWICLGLVVLVLYFADSTNSELQAAANRVVRSRPGRRSQPERAIPPIF